MPTAMPISARHPDPALDTLAREIFANFPLCVRCRRPVERFEEAEIAILANRVRHRACPPDDPSPRTEATTGER